jgi:hypothetical protein
MIEIEQIGDRTIAIKGVGKMFYQQGYPLSMSVKELGKRGIEVSLLHVVEEFWNNGGSWQTIERKLQGELDEDIDKNLKVDFDYLNTFYRYIDDLRLKGGYEQSREMIFRYLFGGDRQVAKNWLITVLEKEITKKAKSL